MEISRKVIIKKKTCKTGEQGSKKVPIDLKHCMEQSGEDELVDVVVKEDYKIVKKKSEPALPTTS